MDRTRRRIWLPRVSRKRSHNRSVGGGGGGGHALGCAPDIPQLPCPAYFPGSSNPSCSAGCLFGGTSVLPVLPQPQLWGLPLQISSHGDKGLIPGLLSLGASSLPLQSWDPFSLAQPKGIQDQDFGLPGCVGPSPGRLSPGAASPAHRAGAG